MHCLKTGFHFETEGLTYASDMYLGDDDTVTVVANRVGYFKAEGSCDCCIYDTLGVLAPGVFRVRMKFGPEYRAFHAEWNSSVPVALLDNPALVVYR